VGPGAGNGSGRLAFTGVTVQPLVVGGLALVLTGGGLLALATRLRRR
jgi:hypothetical protein